MAASVTTIQGDVFLPDGAVKEKSYVIFEMTGFDTEDGVDAVIVPYPIRAPIDETGSINIDLWPNPDGVRSTLYNVTFEIYNGTKAHLVDGHKISIPASGGPYMLSDLLGIAPPASATVEEYIAYLAAAVATVDAASDAMTNSSVIDIAGIEALDFNSRDYGVANLVDVARGGTFYWLDGDYSAEIAADTLQGVYVKADDVDADDGAWVRSFNGPLQAGWFGVSPHQEGDVVADLTDALQALTEFAADYFHNIEFQSGYYFFNKWTLKRGVEYVGLGAVNNWRTGLTSGSEYDPLAESDSGAVFIAMGGDAESVTVPWCTEGRSVGYTRAFSTATSGVEGYDDLHPTATTQIAEAMMFDGSNKDASGATKATLRSLKAAALIEDGWDKITIRNLRIISDSPDATDPQDGGGDRHGLGGYADESIVTPIPDYDFGLFYRNAWGVDFDRLQVVGYWREVGTMCFLPPADGFTNVTANSEQGLIQRCTFQSGLAFRSGDLFPVVDVDGNDVYVRWSASHQFDTTGSLNISNGDTFSGTSEFTYTALAYSTSATPNTAKVGEFLVFTLSDATGVSEGDKIVPITGQGGSSHTRIVDSRITGFDHHSGADQSSDDLAAYCYRYTPALEISGAPMRAIKFENVIFNTMSPVTIHMGAARDATFSNCYAEAKSWRWDAGAAGQNDRGSLFIAGPSSLGDYSDEVGAAGAVSGLLFSGTPLNETVSVAPLFEPRSGVRMSTMTDVFNPREANMKPWTDDSGDNNSEIRLPADAELSIFAQKTDHTYMPVMRVWQTGGTVIVDMGNDDGTSSGSRQMRLRSNGTVEITGDITLTGDVTVTGDLNLEGSLMVDGNQVIDPAGGTMLFDVSLADLEDATSSINTVNKRDGLQVTCNANNRTYTAIGGGATSTWADNDGANNITPS